MNKPGNKIIIVDDHELFRDGLKFFITQITGMEVIGEAANGKEFLNILEYLAPDLVLMDISMPEMDGIQATELALKKFPNLKIIAISSFGDEIYYTKMIKAGVSGFVIKDSGKNELEKAISAILDGKNYFSKDLLQKIVIKKGNLLTSATFHQKINLTKREKDVLALICQGYSDIEIANKLYLSSKTINNYRTHLLSKTATKNAANLVMFAIKNGLIEI